MATQPQAEKVEQESDEGWRVLPNRKTLNTRPTSQTVMVTVVNDKLQAQIVLADGSVRSVKPGELQRWWDGL